MKYLSVCSGVEAASLAWEKLGWIPVAFSEIEPAPSAVLAARWPTVPNLGDMTKISVDKQKGIITNGTDVSIPVDGIDLLVGGTPCQSFSIAGKREGLRGLSGLALDYVRLAYELAAAGARWIVWENVPGVFSSNKGGDFATLLSHLVGYEVGVPEDGWKTAGVVPNRRPNRFGLAWRTIDAQYVRVDGFPYAIPQRRRRVFVVGYFGDWTRAARVLLERESDVGDNPPRRESVEEVARSFGVGDRDADGVDDRAGAGRGEEAESGKGDAGSGTALAALAGGAEDGGDTGRVRPGAGGGDGGSARTVTLPCTLKLRHTGSSNKGRGGEGPMITTGVSCTLSTLQDQTLFCGPAMVCYENHAQDARVKEIDVSDTRSRKDGTGGNNLPLVCALSLGTLQEAQTTSETMNVAHTLDCMHDASSVCVFPATAGALCASDAKGTNGQDANSGKVVAVFSLDSLASNSMKSKNPDSGFHEADCAKTLDTSSQDPVRNQGGQVVCLTPPDTPQTHRVYAVCGAFPSLTANSGGGQDQRAVLIHPFALSDFARFVEADVGTSLRAKSGDYGNGSENICVCFPLDMDKLEPSNAEHSRKGGNGLGVGADGDPSYTLNTVDRHAVCVGFTTKQSEQARSFGETKDCSPTLNNDANHNAVCYGLDCYNLELTGAVAKTITSGATDPHHVPCVIHVPCIVRRLTPVECERLMAFPDNHTAPRFSPERIEELIPFFQDKFETRDRINGKTSPKRKSAAQIRKWLGAMGTADQPDAPRYKACGNSMAVNCMRWIGERIDAVERDEI